MIIVSYDPATWICLTFELTLVRTIVILVVPNIVYFQRIIQVVVKTNTEKYNLSSQLFAGRPNS